MVEDLDELIDGILSVLHRAWSTSRPMLSGDVIANEIGKSLAEVEEALDVMRARRWVKGPKPMGRGLPTLAQIEPGGIEAARRIPEREGPRRRRRILQYMDQQSGGASTRVNTADIADALNVSPERVGRELGILKGQGLVTTQWHADNKPWPTSAILTGIGSQVAEDGWPDSIRPNSGAVYHTQFNAPVANATVGNIGPTTQFASGHAELRQVLDEVEAALAELAEDDEDVKDRHQAVERLGEHLTKAEPEGRPIHRAWNSLVAFATVEGAIQGGERVGRALSALWPYVEPFVDGPPPMLPGVTT